MSNACSQAAASAVAATTAAQSERAAALERENATLLDRLSAALRCSVAPDKLAAQNASGRALELPLYSESRHSFCTLESTFLLSTGVHSLTDHHLCVTSQLQRFTDLRHSVPSLGQSHCEGQQLPRGSQWTMIGHITEIEGAYATKIVQANYAG